MAVLRINGNLEIDYRAREWCRLPYPNHRSGCPNYGKRLSCPPQAPLIEDYLDISKEMWLLVVEFDLAGHIQRMKSLHPNWSDRQLKCVLYWQGGVNKKLKEKCQEFIWGRPETICTLCPEAMGVQVIKTAQKLGLPIRPIPIDTVYKIALAGYKLQWPRTSV